MQTFTIDVLNSKAIRLLEDLELLKLIRFRREKVVQDDSILSLFGAYKTEETAEQIMQSISQSRNFNRNIESL